MGEASVLLTPDIVTSLVILLSEMPFCKQMAPFDSKWTLALTQLEHRVDDEKQRVTQC